jgi:hypothetical protein
MAVCALVLLWAVPVAAYMWVLTCLHDNSLWMNVACFLSFANIWEIPLDASYRHVFKKSHMTMNIVQDLFNFCVFVPRVFRDAACYNGVIVRSVIES